MSNNKNTEWKDKLMKQYKLPNNENNSNRKQLLTEEQRNKILTDKK